MYDVIVVGAGPAGSAAAYDLAAAGQSVLLIDRRQFPRVKPCAGGLTMKTVRLLRYPIASVVRQVCTELVLGRRLEASVALRCEHPTCMMTVRSEFDAYCLARTRAQGAEFRVVPHIHDLVEKDDHVVVHTTSGELSARYVIGADGANSVVRRFQPCAAPVRHGFAIEAEIHGHAAPMRFDFGVIANGYGWLFPKGDHVNAGLYTNEPDVRPGRAELEAYVSRRLGAAEIGRIVGHNVGLGGWSGTPVTRRTALVGDAAGLTDPLLGEGIHNAVASGQAAAAAVLDARNSRVDFAAAYTRRLGPIVEDLSACHRAAARFYAHVDLGYRVLTSRFVAAALMKGYARGMTFSATKRWSAVIAFLPVKSVQR